LGAWFDSRREKSSSVPRKSKRHGTVVAKDTCAAAAAASIDSTFLNTGTDMDVHQHGVGLTDGALNSEHEIEQVRAR